MKSTQFRVLHPNPSKKRNNKDEDSAKIHLNFTVNRKWSNSENRREEETDTS